MIHHTITQIEQANTHVQRGRSMRRSQPAVGFPGGKNRSSLIGRGIESFQFLPIHLTSDVPQTEISDLVARLSLFQQSSVTQDPRTITGMNFADVDVPASGARWAFKPPVQVPTVETQQRTISRMKPRRKRKSVTGGPSWHMGYYTLPDTNKHPIDSLRMRRIDLLGRR